MLGFERKIALYETAQHGHFFEHQFVLVNEKGCFLGITEGFVCIRIVPRKNRASGKDKEIAFQCFVLRSDGPSRQT